jgi:MFS family permease
MQHENPYVAPQVAMPRTGSWYPWAVVGMLWFICFFNYADRQAIAAILPALEDEFGFSKSQQGLIAAAFMWVYALSAPLAGGIGDRTSRKMLILGGLFVWSIVTGFTAACSKLWQFVFVRGAEGLGETFYFPASMSLVSDYHSKRTRSRAMSIHQTSVYAGTIGGSWFAGWMAEVYDWRYPFVILGAAGVVLGVVLAVLIREPRRNEAELLESGSLDVETPVIPAKSQGWIEGTLATIGEVGTFAWDLLRNPPALLLVLAFCGANFVAFVFITWMPSYLREKYDLNLAQAAFSATIYLQLASMVGSVCGGLLADQFSKLFGGGRSFVQALGVIAGAPFIYWCGVTPELTTVLVAMTCFGFAKGIYDSNIWASLYDVVPAEKRSTAVGMTNMIGWIAAGVGTTAFGVVVDQGYTMSETLSSTAVIYVGIAGLLILSSILTARRVTRLQA